MLRRSWAVYLTFQMNVLLPSFEPFKSNCTTILTFQQFCVLPTQCIGVFCVDLRTNSDYFPMQH